LRQLSVFATLKKRDVFGKAMSNPQSSPKQITLSFTLKDANGNVVETNVMPAEAAIAQITQFVLLHGTDPDEQGAGAQAGSVEFSPIVV
jgi:hypothetical protein